ncbi:MAG: hypothetical protein PF486_01360 [Prolixibacteraceae bacterium]|jgi:hypothetical protein|nr:hypothetical protein [Prolixibacteraceae bacterium]
MKNKPIRYKHIKSYKDIQDELVHLGYMSRIHKKELEIHSIQLKHDLHPARLIPSLLADWATPMMYEMRDKMLDLALIMINPYRHRPSKK